MAGIRLRGRLDRNDEAVFLQRMSPVMALFCRAGRANQRPKLGENGLNADMPQRPNLTLNRHEQEYFAAMHRRLRRAMMC
jgi:hypothetical protein